MCQLLRNKLRTLKSNCKYVRFKGCVSQEFGNAGKLSVFLLFFKKEHICKDIFYEQKFVFLAACKEKNTFSR